MILRTRFTGCHASGVQAAHSKMLVGLFEVFNIHEQYTGACRTVLLGTASRPRHRLSDDRYLFVLDGAIAFDGEFKRSRGMFKTNI
jgi:hypothetical protein